MGGRLTVSGRDLRALISVLDNAEREEPVKGRVPEALLTGLQCLIGSDHVTYCDLDVLGEREYVCQELGGGEIPDPLEGMFWKHYHSCAACSYQDLSSDVSAVTMVSDFYSARQWRSHPMFADYLRYSGLAAEMMLSLPGRSGHSPRILFWRASGRFSERDRLLAALLRPRVASICNRPDAGAGGAGGADTARLTERQRYLMSLVAEGLSNRQAARTLGVAEGTVRKHLENIYGRLGVPNRAAAVARVLAESSDLPDWPD